MSFQKEWFDQWNSGDRRGFDDATAWLWEHEYRIVFFFVSKLGFANERVKDLLDEAFWQAMEEMDLSISDGHFLFSRGEQDELIGKVSGRKLGSRAPFEWRGEKPFRSFFRGLWRNRCIDVLHHEHPGPVPVFIEDDDDVEEIGEVDETAVGDRWLLDLDGLLSFVQMLSMASEQLRRRPACRELVEVTILFIKVNLAKCSPQWRERNPDQIAVATIEELVAGADLENFDFSGAEWRLFMMDFLTLTRAALDQRVSRCRQAVRPIFAVLQSQREGN